MSYFYGYLTGNRGDVTRTGSKTSGIRAHLRSWNHDCYAWLYDEDGKDVLQIDCPTDENIKLKINGKEITCTS